MKKLAIVISHPIQHFCPQHANWARNEHWQIKVFFACEFGVKPYYDELFKKMITWPGLKLDEFEHEFLIKDHKGGIGPELDAENLGERLEAYNPDAVLVYGYFQKIQRRAKRWAVKNNKPLFYFSDSELRQDRGVLISILKKFYLRHYFRDIDYFLVNGNANEEYYLNYGVKPAKFIKSSYPIDFNLYLETWEHRAEIRESVRQEYNIPKDRIVLSVVGKLVDKKRQVDIIRMLKTLEYPALTLLIIGTGENEQAWKKEAEDVKNHQIIFTGFIPPDVLPRLYLATDIYVHPASIEPHSVAISEALCMGCAIVLSDKCGSYGTYDDVRNGINGFIYPCGDLERLKNAILKLIEDRPLLTRFREASRNISLEYQHNTHFEILNTLHQLLDLRNKRQAIMPSNSSPALSSEVH